MRRIDNVLIKMGIYDKNEVKRDMGIYKEPKKKVDKGVG